MDPLLGDGADRRARPGAPVGLAAERGSRHPIRRRPGGAIGVFEATRFATGRKNAIRIEIPPLRERTDDIPVLVAHFLSQLGERFGEGLADGHPRIERGDGILEDHY